MNEEQRIQEALIKKFGLTDQEVKVQRPRRVFAAITYDRFRQMLDFALDELDFTMLCALTGFDEGDRLAFMYHIAQERGLMLNIKISVPKDKPVLQTITDRFPSADIYERELIDLLGTDVRGLAEGKRYPLPDDWPAGQYPLRKDWKPSTKTT